MKSISKLARLFLIIASVCTMKSTAFADPVERSALPPKDSFHLFLLAGQSNMAGRGDVSDEDSEINPQILALNAAGEWQHAVDPIHWDKPVAGVGLARSFAREYLKDHPGVTIGFIPAACGGSPISTWVPGAFFDQTNSHPYDDAISRTKNAVKSGTLKGILWHQGESDCHPGLAEAYEIALSELLARFRTEMDAANLPIVLGQLGQFAVNPWGEHTRQVDAATQRIAAASPLVGFVSSEGLGCKADGIHFDSAALHEFGKRYYAVFQRIPTPVQK